MADIIDAPVAAIWDVQLQRVMSINSAKDAARFSSARNREAQTEDPDEGHATFVGRCDPALLQSASSQCLLPRSGRLSTAESAVVIAELGSELPSKAGTRSPTPPSVLLPAFQKCTGISKLQ